MLIPNDSRTTSCVLLAALWFASSAAARADIFTDCLKAIEQNDLEKAKGLANIIRVRRSLQSEEKQQAGAECLSFGLGEKHVYDTATESFTSAQTISERTAAELEDRREREERTFTVLSAVSAACDKVYRVNPDEALTNEVCIEVFLRQGLPGED